MRTSTTTAYLFLECDLPVAIAEDDLPVFGACFEDFADANYVTLERETTAVFWRMRWIAEKRLVPSREDMTARIHLAAKLANYSIKLSAESWRISKVDPDTDWLTLSYQQLQPFAVGPFYLYGAHVDAPLPGNLIPLQIDAATAFGSGEHPTTAGCLIEMHALKNEGFEPKTVLDMGCGSGILAVAAAKLWPEAKIWAADMDPESVKVTMRHAALNAIPETQMTTLCSEGFAAAEVDGSTCQFDLILANILAEPLRNMAQNMRAALAPEGHIILSGILESQAEDVIHAYTLQGFDKINARIIEGWSTLRG